ncbi:MAG: hypothetical protein IJM32_08660 [Ruminococcus sp.]|nr:hypothetical protein [Ruminococcus sp.]
MFCYNKKLRRCRIYGVFALSQAIVNKLVVGPEPTAFSAAQKKAHIPARL